MTKVEELTEDMVFLVQGCDREFFEKYATKLNDLISASHAEGVEEGEEKERERIRIASEEWMVIPAFSHCNVGNDYPDKLHLVPASVLAPKEKP
jgi:hypothetical protein